MSKPMGCHAAAARSPFVAVGTRRWTDLPSTAGHRLDSSGSSRRQQELRPWSAVAFRRDRLTSTLPFRSYAGLSNTR